MEGQGTSRPNILDWIYGFYPKKRLLQCIPMEMLSDEPWEWARQRQQNMWDEDDNCSKGGTRHKLNSFEQKPPHSPGS